MHQATAAEIRKNTASIIRAPRRLPVAEAVHKYMRVPVGVGNSVEWDPDLAPYIIEPMNCLASREYDAVVFVGPARTGKTIGLIDGWVVYNVVCDPSDMLIVQMTEEKAREHSKKRLARTFRVSPEVAKRLSPLRNDNNVHDKTFLAGNYLKIGWPSINIMSSSDFKYVALTDYDRFPENIDGEGDGFSLASKRTTTFMSAGMTLVEGSPGREITNTKWRRQSPHEAPPTTGSLSLYNRGDRRRWYWQCTHCEEYFQPDMEVMTGYRDDTDPVKASEAAHICCPHCNNVITADLKRELNKSGVWLREGETIDGAGNRSGEPRRSRIASFWMEGPAAAYQTWAQLVYKLLTAEQEYEATQSEEALRAVINTDWGRPYLPRASVEQRQSDVLMKRAEDYGKRLVPPKVRFLLAAVDVQGGKKRRFVVQIIGYGENGERWLIDRYNIRFSLRHDENGEALPIRPDAYPEDWQLLVSDVLDKTYRLQSNEEQRMTILAMAVDSGGEEGVTGNAYKFWRQCRRDGLAKRVYLIKGDSTKRQKTITKTFPDNSGRADRRAEVRGEIPVYLLQTDTLKDQLSNNLSRETPGAGYIHFPDWLGEWFYDELTYEERGVDGKWRKPGKGNNEAFDLFCYAQAVAVLRGYEKIRDWENPPAWAREQDANPDIVTGDQPRQKTESKPKARQQNAPKPVLRNNLASDGWSGTPGNGGWL